MLSPESHALMGTMATAWVGSQGIPVLGQTVDVALLTLGVAMAAAQTAAVKDSLWNYVRYASEARDEAGLDTAATHLARAVSTVGVSVVTFILMKKVSGKAQKQPGPPEPPSVLLPEPVLVTGGTEEFSRYAAIIDEPHTPAVALEVVLNENRAAPFFGTLLQRFGIPGEVIVREVIVRT